jgi:hypothetical protein
MFADELDAEHEGSIRLVRRWLSCCRTCGSIAPTR